MTVGGTKVLSLECQIKAHTYYVFTCASHCLFDVDSPNNSPITLRYRWYYHLHLIDGKKEAKRSHVLSKHSQRKMTQAAINTRQSYSDFTSYSSNPFLPDKVTGKLIRYAGWPPDSEMRRLGQAVR